jgi:putative methyltransferase (TIGR04325 family)
MDNRFNTGPAHDSSSNDVGAGLSGGCDGHCHRSGHDARAWSRTGSLVARLIRYNSSMWSGSYPDWETAALSCRTTTLEGQLCAYERALTAVLDGQALFERDSLLQHRPVTCWPLMLALRDLQACGTFRPIVLDYGGGLGSVYFQHRAWWSASRPVTWNVVELPQVAAIGRRLVQDPQLNFFDSLEKAVQHQPPDLIVAAGILPMVARPEALLDTLASLGARWLYLDRIPVSHRNGKTLIARQVVPSNVYESESPFWFFDECKWLKQLSSRFVLVGQSLSDWDDPVWVQGYHYQWRGYLLRPLISP